MEIIIVLVVTSRPKVYMDFLSANVTDVDISTDIRNVTMSDCQTLPITRWGGGGEIEYPCA